MRRWARTLGALTVMLAWSGGLSPGAANEVLVNAVDSYGTAVTDKLNSDLERIGRAFSDAREIQKARRWADWANTPLAIISAALGTVSIVQNISNILSGIEKAENQVALLSYFFKIDGVMEAKSGLTVSMRGPDYQGAVAKMLTEADAARDKTDYQNTVLLYLQGLDRRQSPAPIVINRNTKRELLRGIKDFKDRVRTLVDDMRSKVRGASDVPDEELRSLVQKIESATASVRLSKAQSVEVSPGLALGRINALEWVRREALGKYDTDMAMEQVNAISSATGSICAVTSYFLSGGVSLTSVQHCSPISGTGTLVKAVTLRYKTNARREVDELPFEMLLALPPEAASLWRVSSALADRIKTVVDGHPARVATAQNPPGGQVAASRPPELTFRMKDGSTVSGQVQAESIKVKSSVGTATVPIKDIVSFSEGQLRLKDGSVLKGELAVSSLAVASKYGTLQLNAKDILWFGVGTPPAAVAGAPTPSPQVAAAKPPATGTQAPRPSAPPPTAKLSEPPQAGTLPSHYGVFLSSGGRLVELDQERAETDGVWWSVFPDAYWTGCCTNGPHPEIPSASIKILVFLKGLAGADPILQEFVYVRRLHRLAVDELGEVARVMGPGSAPLRDEVVKGDAWAEMTRPIPLRIGPVPGQQDMIVVEPANTITPGLYAFRILPATAGGPLRYPRNGHLMFWVNFDPSDKTAKCTDWELVSWGTSGIKTGVYPCSKSPIGELSSTSRGATGDTRSDRKTAALPPGSSGGAGQIIKVQFVNESSGPIRLQITGNGQIEVGGKPWATIQPGKSEEIPVMIGQQKLRIEKVRTAGPVLLWAGFRREKTVEIAPDKSVQIKDDDFR